MNETEITYRRLSFSDIDKYHKIRLKCLQDHPDSFGTTYEEEIQKSTYKFDEYLQQESHQNFLTGAFINTDCIGICGFISEQGERTYHRGHLVQIYVLQEYQGKGIGKELISRTIKEAFDTLKIEQILLGVITNNSQANGVYEKLGFEEYGMIKEFLKLEDRYLDKRLMIKYKEK